MISACLVESQFDVDGKTLVQSMM